MEDQRHLNAKKTKRTEEVVAATMKEDAHMTIENIAAHISVSKGAVHNVLKDDLNLVRKSARWVPKLLTLQQERIRVSEAFITAVCHESKALLTLIVTMDETIVSNHTPET